MADVVFKRGNETNLTDADNIDGTLYFAEDTGNIYMGNGTTRIQFGGNGTGTVDLSNVVKTNTANTLDGSKTFTFKGKGIKTQGIDFATESQTSGTTQTKDLTKAGQIIYNNPYRQSNGVLSKTSYFSFAQMATTNSNGQIVSSSYREYFNLPNSATNTALNSNQSYDILTTKNLITVEQGGTGLNSFDSNYLYKGNGTSALIKTGFQELDNGALVQNNKTLLKNSSSGSTIDNYYSEDITVLNNEYSIQFAYYCNDYANYNLELISIGDTLSDGTNSYTILFYDSTSSNIIITDKSLPEWTTFYKNGTAIFEKWDAPQDDKIIFICAPENFDYDYFKNNNQKIQKPVTTNQNHFVQNNKEYFYYSVYDLQNSDQSKWNSLDFSQETKFYTNSFYTYYDNSLHLNGSVIADNGAIRANMFWSTGGMLNQKTENNTLYQSVITSKSLSIEKELTETININGESGLIKLTATKPIVFSLSLQGINSDNYVVLDIGSSQDDLLDLENSLILIHSDSNTSRSVDTIKWKNIDSTSSQIINNNVYCPVGYNFQANTYYLAYVTTIEYNGTNQNLLGEEIPAIYIIQH